MLACSRPAWQKGLLGVNLRDLFGVDEARLRRTACNAVNTLADMLYEVAWVPFRGKSITELIHIISAHTFQKYDYSLIAICGENRVPPPDKDSLLHQPCTKRVIRELEERLDEVLPTDYKRFLRVTDGMEPLWNGNFMLNVLSRADVESRPGSTIPLHRRGPISAYQPGP